MRFGVRVCSNWEHSKEMKASALLPIALVEISACSAAPTLGSRIPFVVKGRRPVPNFVNRGGYS